jgi:hypothetical protein
MRAFQEQLKRERNQARAGAKLFADACRSGDIGQFSAAVEAIRYLPGGWTLDALRVLFPPYQGSAMRLWRGAAARELRLRKLYGPSWSANIEEADFFARCFQTCPGGSVVLETLAPAEAIISAPCLTGPYFEDAHGKRQYDEREYLVDGRRLNTVRVVRRYRQISLEEWKRTQETMC